LKNEELCNWRRKKEQFKASPMLYGIWHWILRIDAKSCSDPGVGKQVDETKTGMLCECQAVFSVYGKKFFLTAGKQSFLK